MYYFALAAESGPSSIRTNSHLRIDLAMPGWCEILRFQNELTEVFASRDFLKFVSSVFLSSHPVERDELRLV